MRLFLLPISKKHTLIYAQKLNHQLTSEKTLADKITSRASATWVSWEGKERGWQKKVTELGNKAFARISYQEWGLKSIPPLVLRRQVQESEDRQEVEVLFPGNFIKQADVPSLLHRLSVERQAIHKKWMWWSLAGIPVSAPFALVPVLPNIPFFYLAFRAWSHWKALSGSKHVQYLLENNLIRPRESDILQRIYNVRKLPAEQTKEIQTALEGVEEGRDREDLVTIFIEKYGAASLDEGGQGLEVNERLLAVKGTGQLVSATFNLPQVEVEIERASEQVEKILKAEESKPK